MAHVQVIADSIELDSPTLVEGLPGAGLVGKIAADHLAETFEMTHFANVHCDGIPRVAVYRPEETDVLAPVRLYADEEHGLLVLQSDVPVSPTAAQDFVGCVTNWFAEHDVFPIYLSGLPVEEKNGVPELYGIATGDADSRIEEAGLVPPREGGLVSGPTGALLAEANERGNDAAGLVVETQAQFPDPEAARVILQGGIEPLTGIDVSTEELVEQAEEIQEARERLAKRLQEAEQDESSQAQPIRGFQ